MNDLELIDFLLESTLFNKELQVNKVEIIATITDKQKHIHFSTLQTIYASVKNRPFYMINNKIIFSRNY